MTDHKQSMPADLQCRTEVSDAGLASTELRRSDDSSALQSGAHSGQCSTIIFCGDAEQVSAGFALALNMMEVHADLLITTLQPTSQHGRTSSDSDHRKILRLNVRQGSYRL